MIHIGYHGDVDLCDDYDDWPDDPIVPGKALSPSAGEAGCANETPTSPDAENREPTDLLATADPSQGVRQTEK